MPHVTIAMTFIKHTIEFVILATALVGLAMKHVILAI